MGNARIPSFMGFTGGGKKKNALIIQPSAELTEIAATPAVTRVRELEEKLGLLRHELDGWCIWPLFRFHAAHALAGEATSPIAKRGPIYSRPQLLRLAVRDVWNVFSSCRPGLPLVLTASSFRTERDQTGRPKDCMFDDLCLRLRDVLKIEAINNRELFESNAKSAFPSQLSNAMLLLFGPLLVSRLPAPRDIVEVARGLLTDLHKEPMWQSFSVDRLSMELVVFRRERTIWREIIRKLQSPIVLMECGYFMHALIAAAKECSAHVLELQHGTFFDGGPEYSWSDYAVAYRDRMPVPDRFLIYGEHWKNILARDRFWKDRCRIVGSARVDSYRDRRNLLHRRTGDECLLVVTTQGRARDGIVKWITDLLTATENWLGLQIVVRVHPVSDYPRKTYVEALPNDPRLSVFAGHEQPSTFGWLARADYHASVNSATHYEAVSLGVRTFVLPLPTHECMRPMVRMGHALLPESPAAMAGMMRQFLGQPISDEIGNYYFHSGAVENMIAELEDVRSSGVER